MSKCIRCGDDAYGRKVCMPCLSDYSSMKIAVVTHLESIHGKMSPDNLKTIQKETKRLVKLWRKDKSLLDVELSKP